MARIELILPRMGESIMEATILHWSKKVGESVVQDETIVEIATDKVDSEIPSPVDGVLVEILYPANSTVAIGKAIAIIDTDQDTTSDIESTPAVVVEAPATAVENISSPPKEPTLADTELKTEETLAQIENAAQLIIKRPMVAASTPSTQTEKYYSPLVRNIARTEGVSKEELDSIAGSGPEGRVTKEDILSYTTQKREFGIPKKHATTAEPQTVIGTPQAPSTGTPPTGVEVIEMDRMRKLIAEHMVMSRKTSPHVTSFVEVDVTNIVLWRNKYKDAFLKKYNEKITYTPIFIEACARAIKDFPMINVSVDGTSIIVKKNINIGMAAALPSGNLIVPVIKNADFLNLPGLTSAVNDLANRARNNALKPAEIQEGTFTITNIGNYGNIMGTPIINQPQVAIMAVGSIVKRPAVIETPQGDVIGIRHMMFISLSYDHRVVDGHLGASFLKRVADYLEAFKGEVIS
jgi:2-oxoglutarate dehydrogenase E2 component (dihydrolipoamide succinyltransferase)